jgi:gamma-glutamylcyclotransferase (GGCT)/AIG2-like uncharacterized protein YtfP
MSNLFAYGTLVCEDIFYSVAGIKLSSAPGVLAAYSRHSIRGQVYPGILPRKSHTVRGIVYFDVSDLLWQRLDRFEGEMYKRKSVTVNCAGNKKISACTYVVRPQFRNFLEQDDWDLQQFLTVGKKIFYNSFSGYTTLNEKNSVRNDLRHGLQPIKTTGRNDE